MARTVRKSGNRGKGVRGASSPSGRLKATGQGMRAAKRPGAQRGRSGALPRQSARSAGISRRGFLKTAGIAAAGVAAAGMGLGGVAHALPWPQGDENPDPVNIISDGNGGWVVYPTGDGTILPEENPFASHPGLPMTIDSRNVQWAVAHVDTSVLSQPKVLLKATLNDDTTPMYFNFLLNVDVGNNAPINGPTPVWPQPTPPQLPPPPPPLPKGNNAAQVVIRNNVAIVGEDMAPYSGGFPAGEMPEDDFTPDRTMIYGGINSFFNTYPYDVHPDQLPDIYGNDYIRPSKVTVRNIYFAYPSRSAVTAKYSCGFEMSDCVIYDLIGAEEFYITQDFGPYYYLLGLPFRYWYVPFRLAMGIELTALFLPGSEAFMDPNPYLFGHSTIANNRVKRRAEADPNFYGFVDIGIYTQFTDMTMVTSNNEVHNFANSGIFLESNTGTAEFTDNKLYNCSYQGVYYPVIFTFPVFESGAIGGRHNFSPFRVASNYIECGLDYGGSKKSQIGITLGGISNATFEDNVIMNDPALAQGEIGVTISGINVAVSSTYFSKNNKILSNESRGLLSGGSQLEIWAGCDGNVCRNNDYGAVLSEEGEERAGASVSSSWCTFVNENFWGNYQGYPQVPCMWFHSGAKDNTVSSLKKGKALQGFDLCKQIYFDPGTEPPANKINGYAKCSAVPQSVKDLMAEKQERFIERAKKRCLDAGGTWDEFTQTCQLPEYP